MYRSMIKMCLLMVSGVLFLGGNALAERQAGAFTVSPLVGYHVIDGSANIDNAPIYGLSLGYNLSPEWAIETDFRYTPTKLDFGNSNDVDIWTVSLGGLYHFRPHAVFDPYLSFGAGFMKYDYEQGSDETNPMGYYGAGIKYALGKSTDLRLDVRHLLDYSNDDRTESPESGGGRFQNHLQAMAGLTFQFGAPPVAVVQEKAPEPVAAKEEVKAPVDSDHDGVFDPQDKCPGTAPGVKVDSDGCPKAEVEVVTLNLTLLFGFDKDQVTPFHYNELSKAAEFIDKYPMYPVVIKGHADAQGPAAYNQDLSQRRADNVRKALIDKYGVAADRMTTIGFGETQPIADNASAEGRKQNRRVEINIQP